MLKLNAYPDSLFKKCSADAFANLGSLRSNFNHMTWPWPNPSCSNWYIASDALDSLRAPRYTFAPFRARNLAVWYPIPVLNKGWKRWTIKIKKTLKSKQQTLLQLPLVFLSNLSSPSQDWKPHFVATRNYPSWVRRVVGKSAKEEDKGPTCQIYKFGEVRGLVFSDKGPRQYNILPTQSDFTPLLVTEIVEKPRRG
jgi:hypothetical protein